MAARALRLETECRLGNGSQKFIVHLASSSLSLAFSVYQKFVAQSTFELYSLVEVAIEQLPRGGKRFNRCTGTPPTNVPMTFIDILDQNKLVCQLANVISHCSTCQAFVYTWSSGIKHTYLYLTENLQVHISCQQVLFFFTFCQLTQLSNFQNTFQELLL